MKFATGHPITNNQTIHDFKDVSLVADDGRTMFEVCIGKDGRSIQIRGVQCYIFGEQLYTEQLQVSPRSSNVIEVRTQPYEETKAAS